MMVFIEVKKPELICLLNTTCMKYGNQQCLQEMLQIHNGQREITATEVVIIWNSNMLSSVTISLKYIDSLVNKKNQLTLEKKSEKCSQ